MKALGKKSLILTLATAATFVFGGNAFAEGLSNHCNQLVKQRIQELKEIQVQVEQSQLTPEERQELEHDLSDTEKMAVTEASLACVLDAKQGSLFGNVSESRANEITSEVESAFEVGLR